MDNKIKVGLMVLVVAIVALFFSVMAPSAAENQQASVEEKSDVDKEALEILKKATDYLSGLEQFRLKSDKTKDVVQESGQKLQFSDSSEVSVKRPDRIFSSRTDDDGIKHNFWYDGKTATMYDEGKKVYGQIRVPETIDEMLDYLETVMEFPFPLADLLYNDLSHLSNIPLSGKFVDVSHLEGIACDHLAFRGESVDWQFWIDRGEKPLFRKIVISYKKLPGEPQLSARLSEWDSQPSLPDTLFQFSVPEGAQRIQVLGSKRPNTQKRGGK